MMQRNLHTLYVYPTIWQSTSKHIYNYYIKYKYYVTIYSIYSTASPPHTSQFQLIISGKPSPSFSLIRVLADRGGIHWLQRLALFLLLFFARLQLLQFQFLFSCSVAFGVLDCMLNWLSIRVSLTSIGRMRVRVLRE